MMRVMFMCYVYASFSCVICYLLCVMCRGELVFDHVRMTNHHWTDVED